MYLNSAFISGVLFASAVLAGHRGEEYESRSPSHVYQSTDDGTVYFSPNWAGAFLEDNNGTFSFVSGTFQVPAASGQNGSGFTVQVGIDGAIPNASSAMFATGINVLVSDNGTSYQAWTSFGKLYFFDLSIFAGDVIRTNVTASSPTSGSTTIENLSNGQIVGKVLNSTSALSQQTAEWVITNIPLGITSQSGTTAQSGTTSQSGATPLPDFGSVNFTDAMAHGPNAETRTLDGANLIDMRLHDTSLTFITVDGSSVTIKQV